MEVDDSDLLQASIKTAYLPSFQCTRTFLENIRIILNGANSIFSIIGFAVTVSTKKLHRCSRNDFFVDCKGKIVLTDVIEMSLCSAVYRDLVAILIDFPAACPLMPWCC